MSTTIQISPDLSAVPAPTRTRARAEAPSKSFADMVEPADRQPTPEPASRRSDPRTGDATSARRSEDVPDDSPPQQAADDDTTAADEAVESAKASQPVETPFATLQQPAPTPIQSTAAPSAGQSANAIDAASAPAGTTAPQPATPVPATAETAPSSPVPAPAADGAVTADASLPQTVAGEAVLATTPDTPPAQATAAPSAPTGAGPSAEAAPVPAANGSDTAAPQQGTPPSAPTSTTATGEAQAEAAVATLAAPTLGLAPAADKASAKSTGSKTGTDTPKQAGDKTQPAASAQTAAAGPTEPAVAPASTEPKAEDGETQAADASPQTGDGSATKTETPRHPDAPRAEPQRNDTVRVDPPRLADAAAARAAAQTPTNATGIQAPVALPHLAVTIASRARGGERQFEIRLDPADLGRIDVKMSIDENGTTTTRISVERSDTLDLMLRDSRSLERALTQAGFKTDDGALQFNLRNGGEDGAFRQQGGSFAGDDTRSQRFLIAGTENAVDGGPPTPPPALGAALYSRGLPRLGGIDVSV